MGPADPLAKESPEMKCRDMEEGSYCNGCTGIPDAECLHYLRNRRSAGPVGSSELLAGSEADGSETRPQSAGPIGRPDEPLVSKTGGVQCPYCDAYCWDKDHLVRHLTAGCE